MPSLTLNISYGINEGIVLSPSELVSNYLHQIPLCTEDGRTLSLETIKQKIVNAQKIIENFLSLKLVKQVIKENRDFNRQEYNSWGYVKCTYPVVEPFELVGTLNGATQVQYPKQWLSFKRMENGYVYFRNIYLMPNTKGGATMNQNNFVFSGISPSLGFFGMANIPNYWEPVYITGWDYDNMPEDIVDVIGKLASIQVLAILGDILLGVGLTSLSVSLDGISQNTSTTRSGQGGLFYGRVKEYGEELKDAKKELKMVYLGLNIQVC